MSRRQGSPRATHDLIADVRKMIESGHPIDLLFNASQLIEVTTEHPLAAATRSRPQTVSAAGLVESFIAADLAETTALLSVIRPLLEDEVLAARIRRELSKRSHKLPPWIAGFERIEVTGVCEMVHALGDGDNITVGVRWPTGHELTACAYIDHNVGTLVKDAFLIPLGVDAAMAQFRELGGDDGATRFDDLDPADARARITGGIAMAQMTVPPFETDTWPSCRAALEWIVAHLPEGGTGYERPEWDEGRQRRLAESFFTSPEGSALAGGADNHDLLEAIMRFPCDYGPGDPLRWSPVAVEILMTGWFVNKVSAPAEFLASMPRVLRAFIAYAHRRRDIPASLTVETLAAVDTYETVYQREIMKGGGGEFDDGEGGAGYGFGYGIGPGLGDVYDDGFVDDFADADLDGRQLGKRMIDLLAAEVGGHDVLDRLDADVLPDEAFDWTGVPDDVRGRVQAVVELTDRCCAERLDLEYRTICRRLVARTARNDAVMFRRKGRDDYAAAAFVWLVGKANAVFSAQSGRITAKDLLAHFGMASGSVSQKATTIRKAARLPGNPYSTYDLCLGDSGLLHSTRRARIIASRDRFAAP
ncbi:MAG TPA: DUF6398 domain-containing protein [Acidimicrobiales bacterium]|nr:DUF6398 domain-containing protein [Acidimicrobiales bacterium]